MIGATAELYVSSNPNYDDTLSNATDTGIKLNFSLCESKYNYKEINEAITGKYLYDNGAKFNGTTATLLDKYSPGWNNVFGLGSFASNYVGSEVNAAPDKIGGLFPSYYNQNIYDILAKYPGGRLYLLFKNGNITNILTSEITSTSALHMSLFLNNHTAYRPLSIDVCGSGAPYDSSW